MRIYVAVIIVLIAVIGFGVYTVGSLEDNTREIMAGFDGMEEAIADGNWNNASSSMTKVQKTWSSHKGWWAIIIDHQEIDNIDMSMARVVKYIELKDRLMAAGEASVLKQMLEHIPEKEKVNLKNIL